MRPFRLCLQGFFPKVADTRHGYVPGLRLLPHYSYMDNATFNNEIRHSITKEIMPEGFRPELFDPTKGGGVAGRGVPGVVWHCLGVQYDQCIGNGGFCGMIVLLYVDVYISSFELTCCSLRVLRRAWTRYS